MTETQQTTGRDLLRLTTAGSVDDGKSTLIGRLLADAGALGVDQLTTLAAQAVREEQEQIDYARITDGLTAEREQGITIDVAYRYFATPARSFILADVPGHEQYTRNMVTGASKATAALILADARTGMTIQTRRHICIAALLGIRDIVLAVNKMDLVDWSAEAFDDVRRRIADFIAPLGFRTAHFVPVSAKRGDNVVRTSELMPWYGDAPLIGVLETLPPSVPDAGGAFRLPVQMALRPAEADAGDFRGAYAIRIGTRTVAARIAPPKMRLDVTTRTTVAGDQTLAMNEIGLTHIRLQDDVAFDAYAACKATGAFIVVDTRTNDTIAAGMVEQDLNASA
jgi:small GTP-binding protein